MNSRYNDTQKVKQWDIDSSKECMHEVSNCYLIRFQSRHQGILPFPIQSILQLVVPELLHGGRRCLLERVESVPLSVAETCDLLPVSHVVVSVVGLAVLVICEFHQSRVTERMVKT